LVGLLFGTLSWAPLRGALDNSALERFLLPPFVVRGELAPGSGTLFGLSLGTLLLGAWAAGTLLLAGFWLLRLLRGLGALRHQARPFAPAGTAGGG
jgi:hypothetical protein